MRVELHGCRGQGNVQGGHFTGRGGGGGIRTICMRVELHGCRGQGNVQGGHFTGGGGALIYNMQYISDPHFARGSLLLGGLCEIQAS